MDQGSFRIVPCTLCLGAATGLLCPPCLADLPRMEGGCPACGSPLFGPECAACIVDPPPWCRLVAPFYFSYPIDRAVYEFKYRGRLSWGRFLASEMADCVAAREERLPGLLIPIPIHRERLSARGFNQSLELARTIGRKLGIPVAPEALHRTDARSSLVGLNARQREQHVRGAFTTSAQEITVRSIAIVDDILTTGATVREAARVLRRARVEAIEVWVAARTPF